MVRVYWVYACLGLSMLQASHNVPNFDISPRWLNIENLVNPAQIFSPIGPRYLRHRPARIDVLLAVQEKHDNIPLPRRPVNPELEKLRDIIDYHGPYKPEEGQMVSHVDYLVRLLDQKQICNEVCAAWHLRNGGTVLLRSNIVNDQAYMRLFDHSINGMALLSCALNFARPGTMPVYLSAFLNNGADPNIVNDGNGDTPLLTVVKTYKNDYRSIDLLIDLLDSLVQRGANPLLKAGHGRQTPRAYAQDELHEHYALYGQYWGFLHENTRIARNIKKLIAIVGRLAQLEQWYQAHGRQAVRSANFIERLAEEYDPDGLPDRDLQELTDEEMHIRASCMPIPIIKRLKHPANGRFTARALINNGEHEVHNGRHLYVPFS